MRANYGAEMVTCFLDRRRDVIARHGSLRWIAELPTHLAGVVVAGLRERFQELTKASGPTPRGRRNEKWIDQMKTDLRDALRSLLRNPLMSGIVVAILAVGLGASVTFFGLVDAVLLKPLPYPEPDRLVHLQNHYGETMTSMSPPDFLDRRDSQFFEAAAAYESQPRNLNLMPSEGGSARPVRGRRVTSEFFDVLGITPHLGGVSFPSAEDAAPPEEVVISHGLWRDALGSSRSIIGRSIRLHGRPVTVQAVLPPGFDFPAGTDVWLPLTFRPDQVADAYRGNEFLLMAGRMTSFASVAQLQSEMDSITSGLLERLDRRGFLVENAWGVRATPMQEQLVATHRPALVALLSSVLLVLLLACFNVANLLLARTSKRSRELALRSSLGATRSRLLRRLLTENLLLAASGGFAGLAMAVWALRTAPSWVPFDITGLDRAGVDLRLAIAGLTLTAGSLVVFGLLPAWQGSAVNLRGMTGRAQVGGSHRLRASFVVAQMGIALVLLVGAGLLLRSFSSLLERDPGFEPEGRIAMQLSLPTADFPEEADRRAALRRITEDLGRVPGVQSAAVADRLPFDGQVATSNFRRIGDAPEDDSPPSAEMTLVGPGFFGALGIPLLEGRGMEPGDAEGPAVAIVDQLAVERFWAGQSPIGQRIYFGSAERTYEVVGVVGSVRQHSLAENSNPHVYLTAGRFVDFEPTVVVSITGLPAVDLVPTLRESLRKALPGVPPFAVRTLDGSLAQHREPTRFQAWLLGSFALSALTLAALGLYGLLSHLVQLRTNEIGLRMALGADRQRILSEVLAEGLKLAAIGALVGTVVASAATQLLHEVLVDVQPNDAKTLAAVVCTLGLVALLASLVPARRASRLDPVRAIQRQ